MKLFPKRTTNRNVPKNVFLVVEFTGIAHRIKTTYYIEKDDYVSYVSSLWGSKPRPATYTDLDILTNGKGDEIIKRFEAWKVRMTRRYK